MGQKVHPRGLRLGIVYNWNSRWFFSNKRSFKDSLISDLKIRKALMNKLAFSSINQIVIDNLKKGEKIKELKIDIKIEPVKKPFLNAYYVSQLVAEKLVRNFPHRSTVHNAMNKVMEAGAKGVKIQLGGRVGGAEISRREKYFLGTIPTSTIREEVDLARHPALTRSGYVGVKVWLCK